MAYRSRKLTEIVLPDFGTMLEPAFEIRTPEKLFDKFLRIVQAMPVEHSSQHFLLENQTMA